MYIFIYNYSEAFFVLFCILYENKIVLWKKNNLILATPLLVFMWIFLFFIFLIFHYERGGGVQGLQFTF